MKKLMFALACAASAAVMGTDTLNNKATFEAFDAGTRAAALTTKDDLGKDTGTKFWQFGTTGSANDASEVMAYETAPENNNNKYLKLETNGDELQRKINAESVNGLYIDTLVQFTATPADSVTQVDGAKLAIWLEGEEDTGYQLKVAGACIDFVNDSPLGVSSTYVLTGTTSILPDTWYRLTVKSLSGVFNVDGIMVPGFQVYINGERLTINAASFTDNLVNAIDTLVSASAASWITDGKSFVTGNAPSFIPSAMCASEGYSFATVAALTSVGFQGSGAIDNVTITDEDPLVVAPTSVEFTITLGANVSSVTYTISDVDGSKELKATGSFPVNIGATVTVTAATPADWYTVTLPDAVTASAEDNSIAVTASATQVEVTNGALPEGTTAAGLGITTGAFASADTAALAPVVKWAQAYGKTPADINAMEFGSNLSYNEKGYLFNMNPAETDDIDAEEEGFKVTSISYNAETGKWEVEDNGKDTWNGKVEIRGAESLTNPTWSKDNAAGPFFKAFLTK